MRTVRVFVDRDLASDEEIELPADTSHHAGGVLRLRAGAGLLLFNGRGGAYAARVTGKSGKLLRVRVGEFRDVEAESPLRVTLAQGISRGQNMDYTLQKAVELGVHEVVPLLTQHSNVRLDAERLERRMLHWRKVIIGACEQCGRHRLPRLRAPEPVAEWICAAVAGRRLLLDPGGERSLGDVDPGDGPVGLLSGPEGGLAPEEGELARERGFIPVRLGPRILRTETAAVAALAAMQYLWGDLR